MRGIKVYRSLVDGWIDGQRLLSLRKSAFLKECALSLCILYAYIANTTLPFSMVIRVLYKISPGSLKESAGS